MAELDPTPKHQDLVHDVGMHRGEDTDFYLRKGFRVVAVEADPDLAAACRTRFAQYIDRGQLTIIQGAIVPAGGPASVTFFKNAEHSPWGTVNAEWAERNSRLGKGSTRIEVPSLTYASVLRDHGVPRYLKVDIEGCDMLCIDALRSFQSRPDYVSLESDKTSFAAIRHEIDVLSDLGYDAFQAIEQSALHHSQIPPVPAREGTYVAHRFEVGASGLFGLELDGKWVSKEEILRRYRTIELGYRLLGDAGVMNAWSLPGAWLARGLLRRALAVVTGEAVPGWYDTHARHGTVLTRGQ